MGSETQLTYSMNCMFISFKLVYDGFREKSVNGLDKAYAPIVIRVACISSIMEWQEQYMVESTGALDSCKLVKQKS